MTSAIQMTWPTQRPTGARSTALLLACLAAGGLLGCGRSPAGAAQRAVPTPQAVKLHLVATKNEPRTLAVTGVLSAQEELVLGMQVAGRLQILNVDVGDAVASGALLAALDRRDFELERDGAAAALATAQARLGNLADQDLASLDVDGAAPVREAQAVLQEAQLQRARLAQMVQEQLRAPADLEGADATLGVAESRLQRARDDVRTWLAEAQQRRIEIQQAEKHLDDARLIAPWDGRVAERHATAGQFLAAGAPVVTLMRVDPLRLRLRVPERLAGEVVIGQDVEFTVDGGADLVRHGRLVRAAAGFDRNDRTRLVEAEVENHAGTLLPAAFCRARIVVDPSQAIVVVPKSAVVTFAGIDRVFTVVGSAGQQRAKGQIVQLGRDLGEAWEITGGVATGARIVLEATGLVQDAAVTVVE